MHEASEHVAAHSPTFEQCQLWCSACTHSDDRDLCETGTFGTLCSSLMTVVCLTSARPAQGGCCRIPSCCASSLCLPRRRSVRSTSTVQPRNACGWVLDSVLVLTWKASIRDLGQASFHADACVRVIISERSCCRCCDKFKRVRIQAKTTALCTYGHHAVCAS